MLRIKQTLDEYVARFDHAACIRNDPLEIPHRYGRPEDAEVAAFVAAMLAYGRVTLFKPVAERLLERMGDSPARFLGNARRGALEALPEGISYRFSRAEDFGLLLAVLGETLRRHGSLQRAFLAADNPAEVDIGTGLTGFMEEMRDVGAGLSRDGVLSRGAIHLLPSPAGGGAAKRACLFLRWMVRRADVDLGLWKGVSPARLVIPLDTHVQRIAACLGLTTKKSPGWGMATEISANLRRLDPGDPLRYDFPLCHLGIGGTCRAGGKGEACSGCPLRDLGRSGEGKDRGRAAYGCRPGRRP